MKKFVIAAASLLVLVVAIGMAASHFTPSALPEPGRMEVFLARKAKHYLIRRSSREVTPASPADQQTSLRNGDRLFGTECAACHGTNGNNPTDAGRWMYPRAAELTSKEVQSYSDREMFWIIGNGIRLSGMPGFGKVETDEHIWDLVAYIRSLRRPVSQEQSR